MKLGLMDQLECSYHGSPYPLECNDDGYGNDSLMEEDDDDDDEEEDEAVEDDVEEVEGEVEAAEGQPRPPAVEEDSDSLDSVEYERKHYLEEIEMPMNQARFVAKHMKNVDKFDKVSNISDFVLDHSVLFHNFKVDRTHY